MEIVEGPLVTEIRQYFYRWAAPGCAQHMESAHRQGNEEMRAVMLQTPSSWTWAWHTVLPPWKFDDVMSCSVSAVLLCFA